jgi:hypothetical protein
VSSVIAPSMRNPERGYRLPRVQCILLLHSCAQRSLCSTLWVFFFLRVNALLSA